MSGKLTFEKVVRAYFACRKRKRKSRGAIEFEFNLEENLVELYEDLKNNSYKIEGGVCFIVLKPKPREVWAASFRDRIVHHIVYNEIAEDFYKRFIKDTFSCIPGRGTLKAAKTLAKYCRSASDNYTKDIYYMKCDIQNFFVLIDKDILFKEVSRYMEIDQKWALDLIKQIIYNDPKINVKINSPLWKFKRLPLYKSLWNAPVEKGLPIGNLTSQFFSNVYLNVLDQYIKKRWRMKYYCRYVDDFVILDDDPKKLNAIHKDLTRFLKKELHLDLHQNKKSVNKIKNGIDFAGFMIKPHRMFLREKILRRIFSAVNSYKADENKFIGDKILSFIKTMNSYIGFLRHVNGYNLRHKIASACTNLFMGCDKNYTKIQATDHKKE